MVAMDDVIILWDMRACATPGVNKIVAETEEIKSYLFSYSLLVVACFLIGMFLF
jgi:hypothetical protein